MRENRKDRFMSMRIVDNDSIQKAMKGYCRVCVNLSSFDPDSVAEVINGVSTTDLTGRFVGGLVGEPNFGSEDELIVYTENIYGANGPFRGGWQVQSTTSSISATIMKLSLENFRIIFPDFQDNGAWANAAGDQVYGRRVSRSGNVTDASYFDNAALVFEGQTDDEVGMIIRLNNVVNVSDSKEFSPDSDGNIAGVEVQLQAHQDLSTLSSSGGTQPPVEFYLPSFAATA